MSFICDVCNKGLKTKQSLETHFKSAAHKKRQEEQDAQDSSVDPPVLCQVVRNNPNANHMVEDVDTDEDDGPEPSLEEQNQTLMYIIERKDAQIQYLTKLIANLIVDKNYAIRILDQASQSSPTQEESMNSGNKSPDSS